MFSKTFSIAWYNKQNTEADLKEATSDAIL